MERKVCIKCNELKFISEFEYRSDTHKYRNVCKNCRSRQEKEWRITHTEDIKKYRANNNEHIKERAKNYYEKHAEHLREYSRDYHVKHREERNKKAKEWKQQNKEYVSKYNKEYGINHAEEILNRHREYVKENQEILKKKRRIHLKERRENDNFFRYKEHVRRLIIKSFIRKGYKKSSKTYEIVGCDYNTLLDHLKKTYKDNYGVEWNEKEEVHIDHIIPIASAKDEKDVIRLNHYTNLQLLKPQDNLEKRDKLDWKLNDSNK